MYVWCPVGRVVRGLNWPFRQFFKNSQDELIWSVGRNLIPCAESGCEYDERVMGVC